MHFVWVWTYGLLGKKYFFKTFEWTLRMYDRCSKITSGWILYENWIFMAFASTLIILVLSAQTVDFIFSESKSRGNLLRWTSCNCSKNASFISRERVSLKVLCFVRVSSVLISLFLMFCVSTLAYLADRCYFFLVNGRYLLLLSVGFYCNPIWVYISFVVIIAANTKQVLLVYQTEIVAARAWSLKPSFQRKTELHSHLTLTSGKYTFISHFTLHIECWCNVFFERGRLRL